MSSVVQQYNYMQPDTVRHVVKYLSTDCLIKSGINIVTIKIELEFPSYGLLSKQYD